MPARNVRPITPADPSVRILSRYDWPHLYVFSAFAFVAAYAMLSVARARVPNDEHARRAHAPADRAARRRARWAGATGTLVFGAWLAVDVDQYSPLDGWIVAAFVLWPRRGGSDPPRDLFFKLARRRAIAPEHPRAASRRGEARSVFHSRRALTLHLVGSSALLGLLAVMIFKPGA